MRNKDKLVLLGVVALALVAVIGLTMYMSEGRKSEDEAANVVSSSNVGDPGQEVPREESVDLETEVEPADGDYIDVSTTLETVQQDAVDASQEDLYGYWVTLRDSDSSYEKVKAYDLLLTGMRNMIMRGENPEVVSQFPMEEDSGFSRVSLDVSETVVDLYSILLPESATLSSSRASTLVVLSRDGEPFYSEYLSKKDNRLMEGAVVLGDNGIGVYGPVMDQSYGTAAQMWFVQGVGVDTASTVPRSIRSSQNLGTLVVADSDGVLYLKSGVDGVSVSPRMELTGLQFVCSDGSETLAVVGEMSDLYTKITVGEPAVVEEPVESVPSRTTEELLQDVEIPQFD